MGFSAEGEQSPGIQVALDQVGEPLDVAFPRKAW